MASPELDKLVSMLRTAKISSDTPIEEVRAGWEKFAASFVPAADLSFKPDVAGGVAAEWVTAPDSDPSRVVVYLPGGAYTIGSIARHRRCSGRLARASASRPLSGG